ncbi:alkaline phosphatase D family protein [Salipiger sp. 1_MG-2023]|uniref:alkaline phosphatase D family protein n=1 Tax=Salipiger sp. 1_MG-2023 TaxID=3062665 RepID=UPI0026E44B97|nr:alkaline phosphatase D family protein [Salipiger sp. 1_MG-2023]MDO6587947.1 alkaline phosphatase D family protein [Salipiger sp. 1_MG-2023]
MTTGGERVGPVLFFRGMEGQGVRLAALLVCPAGEQPGPLRAGGQDVAPQRLTSCAGRVAWRYDFALGAGDPAYALGGVSYAVSLPTQGDISIAYVSCNGQEHGDWERPADLRNAMWQRLARRHAATPFCLLLMGGDQVYADAATDGHPLTNDWPEHIPRAPSPEALRGLESHLRERFFDLYLRGFAAGPCAQLVARVPQLAMWDDHDICDGWGSLSSEATHSAIGQCLFHVAREMALLFQHGAVEAAAPQLFLDPGGQSLSWRHALPGVTLLAPDLRSERGRRQVMGLEGWKGVEETQGGGRMFLLSSVPLLGPRLSLIEGAMMAIPRMQKYEDDLRDQWQSRAHRAEWRRMLREVLRMHARGPVTVLSGEIHLATRAEMTTPDGPLHQLVASGISHGAPSVWYARALGLLSGLGEAPLERHPIRILPLPGQRRRYVAQRNFLALERRGGEWRAIWELEETGSTPPLAI